MPLARANLREGVIWAQPDTAEARETTQEMADDYVRMACAEAKAPYVAVCNSSASLSQWDGEQLVTVVPLYKGVDLIAGTDLIPGPS